MMWRAHIIPTLSLVTSFGTLICCALPALLVTLGLGAALSGLVSAAPFLVTLTEYKLWIFTISGVLIICSAIHLWLRRNAPCPVEPEKAKACQNLRKISVYMVGFAMFVYLIGFFFAFIAPKIL